MSANPISATQLQFVCRLYTFLISNCISLDEAAAVRKLISYFLFTKRAPDTCLYLALTSNIDKTSVL